MMKSLIVSIFALFFVWTPLYGTGGGEGAGAPTRLPLPAKATLHTAPNYALSTDAEDAAQLTDGKRSRLGRLMWTQKDSVSWQSRSAVLITLDLEDVKLVDRVRFSTASHLGSGVSWPGEIAVFFSRDGQRWQYVEDLIAQARESGTHPPEAKVEGQVHTFESRPILAEARYIGIAARGTPYLSCDEIEVTPAEGMKEGAHGVEARPIVEGVEGMEAFLMELRTIAGMKRRVEADRRALRQRMVAIGHDEEELVAALDAIPATRYRHGEQFGADYRAIFPLNEEHRLLFELQARLWRRAGMTRPVVSTAYRYDWLSHLHDAVARPAPSPELIIKLLGGERRSALLLLSNPLPEPLEVEVGSEGIPIEALELFEAVWTDTREGVGVADALLPLQGGRPYAGRFVIPSGMAKKLWISVKSNLLEPGKYSGALRLQGKREFSETIPLTVAVSPVKLQRAEFKLGLWDYIASGVGVGAGAGRVYGITERNRDAALAFMKSGGVNLAWISRSGIPWPEAEWNEAQVRQQLRAMAARVLADWPNASSYLLFLHVGEKFGGERLGSEAFEAKLAFWLRELEAAFAEYSVPPEQLLLLAVDEPYNEARALLSAAWSRAILAAQPRCRIFTDPVWKDFAALPKEYIGLADVISPHIQLFRQAGEAEREHFLKLAREGKELWFYICAGPTRLADPVGYYRMAPWFVHHHGAAGLNFWAMGDVGGAVSSWNEYTSVLRSYAPGFVGSSTVERSIHWEALQEGVADYSYFEMLKTAAAQNPELKERAEALFARAAAELSRIPEGKGGDEIVNDFWYNATSAESVDGLRLQIIALLQEAAGHSSSLPGLAHEGGLWERMLDKLKRVRHIAR